MVITPELSRIFCHSTRSASRSESCWVPPCGGTNIAHHGAVLYRLLLQRVTVARFQLMGAAISCEWMNKWMDG